MIVLVNGGPKLSRYGISPYLGRLVSPRSGNVPEPHEQWAADNDAFGAWDENRFVSMLKRIENWDRSNCLFVACPDVVGNARKTIDRFWNWRWEIAGRGLPVAIVAQDGIENMDVEWSAFDCLFIGGSTEWKLSLSASDIALEAKLHSKWLHMGRVNSRRRLRIAYDLGCDSIDGTGWSKFPDTYLKNEFAYLTSLRKQTTMFTHT